MAGSLIWRLLGIIAALALGWWILTKTTVSLVVNYGFSAPAAIHVNPTPTPATPAGPVTGTAPAASAQVSSDTKLIMEAMERMDLRQQERDKTQDGRLDEFGRRLDSLSTGAPSPAPTPAACPQGCSPVAGVQRISAR